MEYGLVFLGNKYVCYFIFHCVYRFFVAFTIFCDFSAKRLAHTQSNVFVTTRIRNIKQWAFHHWNGLQYILRSFTLHFKKVSNRKRCFPPIVNCPFSVLSVSWVFSISSLLLMVVWLFVNPLEVVGQATKHCEHHHYIQVLLENITHESTSQ